MRPAPATVPSDVLEQLGDVPDVGECAFPGRLVEEAGLDRTEGRESFEDGGEAGAGVDVVQFAEQSADLHDQRFALRIDVGHRAAEQRGERGEPDAIGAMGLLERVEHPQPVLRGRGGEHTRAPGDHARHVRLRQRVVDECHLLVFAHEDRDVPGLHALGTGTEVEGDVLVVEQAHDVGRHVAGDPPAQAVEVLRETPVVERTGTGTGQVTHPQGRDAREPGIGGCRLHRVHHDAGITEGRTEMDVFERPDENAVAAPVGGQLAVGVGFGDGVEIAEHLAPRKA